MQQAIMHTSQIPTTSGSQTPRTTDSINLDAEDSSQSDYDQLSWQEVAGREPVSATQDDCQQKRTKLKEQQPIQGNYNTYNKLFLPFIK
jgi:hypothetical protein